MSIHERSGISRTTYEQYPLTERVRTPAGRAVAIAALLAASAVVVAGVARAEIVLIVLGAVAFVPAMAAVNVVAGGVTAMRPSELDERELGRRDAAQSLAHRITGSVLFGAVLVAGLALPDEIARETVVAGVFAIFLLQLAAPSLVLASTTRLSRRT